MLFRFFSFLSIIGNTIAQFRDPLLTIAPPTAVPVLTIGPIEPIRTIRPILRTTTSQNNITTTIPELITSTTSTFINIPDNDSLSDVFDLNLLFVIIPSSVLFLFSVIYCLKKRRRNVNVINIDLNIENNISEQNSTDEPVRKNSNISDHFYEEIDYEARYEMPFQKTVKYENIVTENEYGKQVTTII